MLQFHAFADFFGKIGVGNCKNYFNSTKIRKFFLNCKKNLLFPVKWNLQKLEAPFKIAETPSAKKLITHIVEKSNRKCYFWNFLELSGNVIYKFQRILIVYWKYLTVLTEITKVWAIFFRVRANSLKIAQIYITSLYSVLKCIMSYDCPIKDINTPTGLASPTPYQTGEDPTPHPTRRKLPHGFLINGRIINALQPSRSAPILLKQ